jgi:hypothetical protein
MSHSFILQVQEQRRPNIVHQLKVHWFNTVRDVKRLLESIVSFPADRLLILLASTMQVLQNTQILNELHLPVGEPTLVVSYGFGISGGYQIEGAKGISIDVDSKDLLKQAQQGLNKNIPGKTDGFDCTGGVYFLKSASGSIVGVFKPQDEEQGMINNPKGHAGNGTQGLRPHFKPGDGYLREYAAYLMDHDHFCNVPSTTIASCEHPIFSYANDKSKGTYPKVGSLQRYIRSNDTYDDISPSLMSIFEVQKIALFDMRILNCDRNAANILAVRKVFSHPSERRNSRGESLSSVGELNDVELDVLDFIAGSSHFKESSRPMDTYELIPIDHGYSLPTRLQIDDFDWAWYSSKQVREPVHPKIKNYLNGLNFDELMSKVTSEVALSEDTVFLLRTVHELLVGGVNAGLTLYDIASLIVRVEDGAPSPLEKLISRAEENAYSTIEVREGHRLAKVSAVMENGSPVRRVRSPTNILASTPPRVSELLKLKRMVKSEFFQADTASTDEGGEIRQSMSTVVGITHDDDYFVKDLEGDHSPDPSSVTTSAMMYSPSFAMQGQNLITMRTLDSAGLLSFGRSQTAVENIDGRFVANQSSSVLDKAEEHFEACDGLTNSEASSYESVGHSPRNYLDISFMSASRVPAFGSPTFFQQAAIRSSSSSSTTVNAPTATVGKSGLSAALANKPVASSKENVDCAHSFEALEVRTFEALVFDKPSATRGSSQTVEEGYDMVTDLDHVCSISPTPSEHMFDHLRLPGQPPHLKAENGTRTPQPVFSTENLQAIPMARVTSFNALESPPLYDAQTEKGHRMMRHLRREKRKHLGKSVEFPGLRLKFAQHYVKKMIASANLSSDSF